MPQFVFSAEIWLRSTSTSACSILIISLRISFPSLEKKYSLLVYESILPQTLETFFLYQPLNLVYQSLLVLPHKYCLRSHLPILISTALIQPCPFSPLNCWNKLITSCECFYLCYYNSCSILLVTGVILKYKSNNVFPLLKTAYGSPLHQVVVSTSWSDTSIDLLKVLLSFFERKISPGREFFIFIQLYLFMHIFISLFVFWLIY